MRTELTAAAAAAIAALGAAPMGAAADHARHGHHAGAAPTASRPIKASSAWRRYVLAPSSPVVHPVRVVSVTGQITDPDAVLAGHTGSTTLTYPSGGTAPVLVLDYGKELGGYIHFTVGSITGSPTLQTAYSETLANLTSKGDGGTSSGAGSGSPNRYDDFTPTGTATLSGVDFQGGQRYELLTLTKPGTVTLTSASMTFSAFRGTPSTYRGYFLSNSDLLNRVWYSGAYTINLDQVLPGTPGYTPGTVVQTPNIVDGAKRDRDVWIGDLTVAGRTALDAFGDIGAEYLKGSLSLIGGYPEQNAVFFSSNRGSASTPGPMPGVCSGDVGASCSFYSATYSMDFVLSLYDYYLYTGDAAFVATEWPMVQRELAWENSQVDVTGLFGTTALDGADWDTNFVHPSGDYAADSVLHYESLLDGAALAKAVGRFDLAQTYLTDAAAAKTAINNELWDSSLDAYDASTLEHGFLLQDANVWAVLYGVAPPARSQLIIHNLATGLASPWGMQAFASNAPPDYTFPLVSPYIGSFAVWADYQQGRPDLGLSLLQTEWGWILNHDPATADWERIQLGGSLTSQDSTAHGWSTGATSALSQYVLGIQPSAPGFRSWRVEPATYGLQWAQGRVPTAYGPLASRWQLGPGQRSFELTVVAPRGTAGEVDVPELGSARTIWEDGHVVWRSGQPARGVQASEADGYVEFQGRVGTHTYAWG